MLCRHLAYLFSVVASNAAFTLAIHEPVILVDTVSDEGHSISPAGVDANNLRGPSLMTDAREDASPSAQDAAITAALLEDKSLRDLILHPSKFVEDTTKEAEAADDRTKEAAEGSTASDGDAKEDSEWFWGRPSECNGHLWGKGYQTSDWCRGGDKIMVFRANQGDYWVQIWKQGIQAGGISIFGSYDSWFGNLVPIDDRRHLWCCPASAGTSLRGCAGVRTLPEVSDYGYVEYHPSGRICWYYSNLLII